MTWARVDDGWWCHRKVLALDLAARGLWISALSWSCAQRSDEIPAAFLPMVGATDAQADALVTAGLWVPNGDGWRIHDWDAYQQRTLSEKRADAGRKGGRRSGEARSKAAADRACLTKQTASETGSDLQGPEANGKQASVASGSKPQADGEAGTRPVPSRPVPVPSRKGLEPPSSPGGDGEVERQFAAFWDVYPQRNGRKVGKANALIEWRKLTVEERRRAYIGARHLAASDQLPKDPERFLRRAKGGRGGFPFDDWQDPPTVDAADLAGDDLRDAARRLREVGR